MNNELLTSIENPTLAHFRHFRHFSSLLTNLPSTLVERSLQIQLFLTNKPNFQKSQMNLSAVITMNYEQMDTWSRGKNKPNSNPIQSQYKANTKPIQTQFKPNSNPNKANPSTSLRTGFPIILVSLSWICIISFYIMVT